MNRQSKAAKEAFYKQRNVARLNNINWHLTYDQWCDIWKDKWELRGSSKDCYFMSRVDKTKPFSISNVRIEIGSNKPTTKLKSHTHNKQWSSQYYTYNGNRYENRKDLLDKTGLTLSRMKKKQREGEIQSWKKSKPYTLYKTPYGVFTKRSLAIESVRDNENPDISSTGVEYRFSSDNFIGYSKEIITPPDIIVSTR